MNVAPLFWCFIVRFYHPRRSTRMLVSVGADIRIGRRRHPHRSAQTSASVDADVLIGGYGIPAIPTQPPPRHPHAVTSTQQIAWGVSKAVSDTPRRGRST